MSKISELVKENMKKVMVFPSISITPAIAKELLELNTDNRPVKERTVLLYSEEMKAGNWKFNGDSIRFSKAGRLIDGQHRLMAIIKSGTTQIFNVQTGLDDDSFAVIDIGKNRSAGDVLAMAKYKSPSILAAAAKIIMAYDSGMLANNKNMQKHERTSHQDILNWLESKDTVVLSACVDKAGKYNRNAKLFAPGTYAAFLYLFSRKNVQQAEEFFEKFSTGEGISSKSDSSIYILRQKLINIQASKTMNFDVDHRYALLIKAWNLFRKKKEVKKLYWSTDEEFPKIK